MFLLTARINLSLSEAKRILGNRAVGDNRLFSRNGWNFSSIDNHANRGMSFEGLINQSSKRILSTERFRFDHKGPNGIYSNSKGWANRFHKGRSQKRRRLCWRF